MRVQYADEAIVVTKLVPMKTSNSMEEKIQVTHHIVDVTVVVQTAMTDAKGERDFKVYMERVLNKSEHVKRKLKCWKVRIVGIRKLANYIDDIDMK